MDTDILNPVIDANADSSTAVEDVIDNASSQETDGSELSEDLDLQDDFQEEDSSGDYDSPEDDRPAVEKRISQLVAEKKSAEKTLAERTEQIQAFLSEAHQIPSRPQRESYSSDESYEGALINYKMKLASSEDARRKASEFVKDSLRKSLGELANKDMEAIQNLDGMPSSFFEILAVSKNPVAIVEAMKDPSKKERLKNLPPHLLGDAMARMDVMKTSSSSKKAAKDSRPKDKSFNPIAEARPQSTKRNQRESMEQIVARLRGRK